MKKLIVIGAVCLCCLQAAAEETGIIEMSLQDAEQYFGEHNLKLLAEHYEVKKADAAIVQARLFDNPVLSFEQNIYNRINGRYFDFGPEGETAVEVEQLINLAGQRNKRVKVEKMNREVAMYQLEEVARTLRSELKQQFVELYFANKSRKVYDRQITSLGNLLKTYREQEEKGNVSKLEKGRIEALLLSLQQERNELDNRIGILQEEVKLLLGMDSRSRFSPLLDEQALGRIRLDSLSFGTLLEHVYGRPDIRMAQAGTRAAQANVKLQRSLAAPEFSIVGKYDKAGNFINDYWAVGFNVSLPIFNRNQGNIKAAKLSVKQNMELEQYARNRAEGELHAGYARLEKALLLYRDANHSLESELAGVMEGVNRSFRERDISLIEFVDYYETYKTACLQLNSIKQELLQALENVNIIAGKNIFTY